jgi:hypothetical protein
MSFLQEYNKEEEKNKFEDSMKIYDNFQKFCNKNGPFGKRGITMRVHAPGLVIVKVT